jgi:hypothetical protein
MMPQSSAVVLWSLAFAVGSAMVLGFLPGRYFASVDHGMPTTIIIGLLWVVIPTTLGAVATHLGNSGKLPGTRQK